MGRVLNYVFAGMIFCGGVSHGWEPVTIIEEPTPYLTRIVEGTSEKDNGVFRSLDGLSESTKKTVKRFDELNYGGDYVRRKNSGLLEIRFEGESKEDYVGRMMEKKLFSVYPSSQKFKNFEVSPNLLRNGGGRGLINSTKRYVPIIDIDKREVNPLEDDSYLK